MMNITTMTTMMSIWMAIKNKTPAPMAATPMNFQSTTKANVLKATWTFAIQSAMSTRQAARPMLLNLYPDFYISVNTFQGQQLWQSLSR
jgi:hypothetical protein